MIKYNVRKVFCILVCPIPRDLSSLFFVIREAELVNLTLAEEFQARILVADVNITPFLRVFMDTVFWNIVNDTL